MSPSFIERIMFVCAMAAISASCGPSVEEEAQARETQRLRRAAESAEALATFAKAHAAMPVSIMDSDRERRSFTAELQRQLEGAVVAFRSSLLDVVREPRSGSYTAVLGDRFFGGTLATLSIDEQQASKLLATSLEDDSDFLVAARIDSVVPLVLTLQPCRDADCSDVEIEVRRYDSAYRINGSAIVIQPEP